MCGTCGCGSGQREVVLQNPLEKNHYHLHADHHHEHHEHGHDHNHNHDHHHPETVTEKVLAVEKSILHHNDKMAAQLRGFLEAKNIFSINLVSAPGSGKTTLLERTLQDLKEKLRFTVIEGDQQTLNDANRIAATGVPVMQINTGKGCHLESDMVYEAVKKLKPAENSVLFIENVGNLVCPSLFDLGESQRVVIVSTTEGEDKPLKYPDMFASSDVCIINKIDLLPYLRFDMEKLKDNALKVHPHLRFFEVSAAHGEGLSAWYDWLQNKVQLKN